MNQITPKQQLTRRQGIQVSIATIIYMVLCSGPALYWNGYIADAPCLHSLSSLQTALIVATIGGALSGVISLFPKHLLAGMIGGAIAGPSGLVVLNLYILILHRQNLFNYEIVLIEMLACLPGITVGKYIANARQEGTLKPPNQGPRLSGEESK